MAVDLAASRELRSSFRALGEPRASARGSGNPGANAPGSPVLKQLPGRKGATIYVSKLGDDSDGSSWRKAFRTIQKGLLAVPAGFRRLGLWPTELFEHLAPPRQ